MNKYIVIYRVKDGIIRKNTYDFRETIEAENPRQAFEIAKDLAKQSSSLGTKWEIKEITKKEEYKEW